MKTFETKDAALYSFLLRKDFTGTGDAMGRDTRFTFQDSPKLQTAIADYWREYQLRALRDMFVDGKHVSTGGTFQTCQKTAKLLVETESAELVDGPTLERRRGIWYGR